MEPLIFFNVGWMKRYQGLAEDDRPQRGGKWVEEHEWDHSMLNFLAFKGWHYGYGQPQGNQIKLERLGAAPDADRLDHVTVVWVSTPPTGGTVIVGWYRDATLFRDYQEPPKGSGRTHEGKAIGFYATAKAEDCVLLPEDARAFSIPRGRGGMGQSNVWYADQPAHQAFRQQVLDYIASGGKTPPRASARAWIFQANPELYDIDSALRQLPEVTWSVSKHQEVIAPGDTVFVWKSGPEAGILAGATVLTVPAEMEPEQREIQFVIHPEKFASKQVGVRIRVDEVFSPPLLRSELKADPRLADLSILKFSQGTNFPVTPEEATVIRELLARGPGDEDDITAGKREPGTDFRVWAYAPGRNAQFWEEFYREEIMAIGWDELGDLRQYPDHQTVAKKLIEVYKLESQPINDSRACFDFAHTIRPGDRIFAKRGRDEVVGYGVVTGDYEYREDRAQFKHVRRVRWEQRGNWKCKPLFPVKTLIDFTPYPEVVQDLTALIGRLPPIPPPPVRPYTTEDALTGAAFDRAAFQRILDQWRLKKNLILQGPPGVGKTFLARRFAYALIGHEVPSRVGMVQFHQSYSYEDFIQGYRPAEGGFARKDGVFVRFSKRASLDQDSIYVFIIDEINRSNLSKVFGELLMLIEADKRGSKYSVALTYSASEEEQFYVPANLFLLGMMNTADRSLALVDYALRRRFAFVELEPLFGTPEFSRFLADAGSDQTLVAAVSARLQSLNQVIAEDQNLGPGFTIGHSYFCGNGSALTEDACLSAVRHEIVPLLKEYWFDDPERVKEWTEKLLAKFE